MATAKENAIYGLIQRWNLVHYKEQVRGLNDDVIMHDSVEKCDDPDTAVCASFEGAEKFKGWIDEKEFRRCAY